MLRVTGSGPICEQRSSSSNEKRNLRRERLLWHEPVCVTSALGCTACPERHICGGLSVQAAFFDCLQFCCQDPISCDRVCRNHPDYVDRVREVGTFSLDTVPRAPELSAPVLPCLVPVIYSRTGRVGAPVMDTVALSLYALFDRRSGLPRHASRASLNETFALPPDATIILTGTDRDPPLERWWKLGEEGRRRIIRTMIAAGIRLVTTPNYSLFTDRPRWDNLHSMKRIAIVHEEFLRAGLPAALHVNGRTDSDFERWANYISARSEITHIAYEFTTGTGWNGRRGQHAAWLAKMATAVERPLHLVMRGGLDQLPALAAAFSGFTVLDTSIFIKTMKRQCAYPKSNSALGWKRAPTERGAPVDSLFANNFHTVDAWMRDLILPTRTMA